MDPLEARIDRMEAQLRELTPSLSERLAHLEAAVPRPVRPDAELPRSRLRRAGEAFLGWLGPELPKFIAAVVLILIAWGLKDSVDLAIKQRQLDLSYAKEMQSLLREMGNPDAGPTLLEPTAVVIATYGDAAIPALLNELRAGGLRGQAAITGLTSLPPIATDGGCAALLRVISTRGQQYDWLSQMNVVKLLGESDCRHARDILVHYRQKVDSALHGAPKDYAASVRSLPLSPAEEYPKILAAIDHTLASLRK